MFHLKYTALPVVSMPVTATTATTAKPPHACNRIHRIP
jgi:hypothetical protein